MVSTVRSQLQNQMHPLGQPLGQVRRAFWALLIGALLLAMTPPAITLWHAASSALAVRACVWPAAPQARSTARVLVDVLDPADRMALQGPWAQITVEWDMETMSMGREHAAVPGQAGGQGEFAVPLALAMAGPWWVHVSVSTPGRPKWQALMRFRVMPAVPVPADPSGVGAQMARQQCPPTRGSGSA
jgi:hypothetical protein